MADVEMTEEIPQKQPVPSIETKENEKTVKSTSAEEPGEEAGAAAEGSDNDAPGDNDDEGIEVTDTTDGRGTGDLYKNFKAITELLLNFKITIRGNEEHFPSGIFKRLPNKRLFPDYYEVVKEPSAISTLRGKIQRKQYSGVPEFVRDFALVVHNAQVYNRPNSQPVRDVLRLDELFKTELQRLVDEGLATEDEIKYPDLGEIPQSTPEPDPVSEEDDEDGDDDDDDEEAEGEESDDEKRKKRNRRGTKNAGPGKKADEEDDDDKAADAEQKRRGRPPKVATPMEHRIDRILKSLKKPKSKDGVFMLGPFERLPDKAEMPEYYQVITQPMAYDVLKKKAKRKKYSSTEEFMKDVELMFKNAMHFNEDGSDIHTWAQELLEEARKIEAEERAKPDSEYLQAAEGRIPLPHIIYKGDMWKVGDWIHIQNPNDITKPIVAQIYRTWKTANGEEWINACWYYRPEQTIHQYEKHFYPNEVVKTGQYRDHKIEEVLNKCFVMFYTRYSRGRPRGLLADTEIYVCEARYNEERSKFNKIKTWASCLPDEVRDKDYEMDLFDAPRKIKKVPSPLLSRLKEDTKETDELPQPEWKHANAPPLVGGIHKRQRDENQSPPPEPTPPPQPIPTPITRNPSISQPDDMNRNNGWMGDRQSIPRAQIHAQPPSVRPTPALTPQTSYNSNTIQLNRQSSYGANAQPYQNSTPNLAQQPTHQYQYNQAAQPAPIAAAHPGSYSSMNTPVNYGRPAPTPVQATQYNQQQSNGMSRGTEAYVLSDSANASIPKEIRDQFPTDDQGRLLFFTQPPLDTRHIVTGSAQTEKAQPLQHSEQYMKTLAIRKRKLAEQRTEGMDVDSGDDTASAKSKQVKMDDDDAKATLSQNLDIPQEQIKQRATALLAAQAKNAIYHDYETNYDGEWREILLADLDYQALCHQMAVEKQQLASEQRKAFNESHLGKLNGQYGVNAQGYITDWRKNFFTGSYLDDYDSRLP